jgi:bidirectional [NiFe] hydrogenase diaphorase subunit
VSFVTAVVCAQSQHFAGEFHKLLLTALAAKEGKLPVTPDPNRPAPPKLVEATMRRMGNSPRGLIESLHTVQEVFGYLDLDALRFVARALRVPLSRAYGVATFYHFFSLRPPGEHTCVVCIGTACYIKGAPQLLAAIKQELGVVPGQTTADGKVSVLGARCLGSCGLAPAVVYDRDVAGKVTPQALRDHLAKWKSHVS